MEILVILIIIIRREFYHIIRIFLLFSCISWFMSSIRQFYHLMDVTVSSRDVSYNVHLLKKWEPRLVISLACIVIFVSQFSNYDLRAEISDNRIPSYRHGVTDSLELFGNKPHLVLPEIFHQSCW